jgi:hypothetical protein
MPSLLEALKKAELVDPKKAASVEEERTKKLKAQETLSKDLANIRALSDTIAAEKDEKHVQRAAKEATKASSRVGTAQYFNRFK